MEITWLRRLALRIVVLNNIWDKVHEARASVPRGDVEAATSAFLSDVAVTTLLAEYFPWLEPGVEPCEEDLGFRSDE